MQVAAQAALCKLLCACFFPSCSAQRKSLCARCSVQVSLRKLCSGQAFLCKLLCASCSAQVDSRAPHGRSLRDVFGKANPNKKQPDPCCGPVSPVLAAVRNVTSIGPTTTTHALTIVFSSAQGEFSQTSTFWFESGSRMTVVCCAVCGLPLS